MQECTIPELVDAFRQKKFPRRQFVRNLSAMGISAVGIRESLYYDVAELRRQLG